MTGLSRKCVVSYLLLLIADRIYRLRNIKEYQQAKDAQIAALQQQLEFERRNNDTELAELHKRRYKNLKLILDDQQNEIAVRDQLTEQLTEELNQIALAKHRLETERKALQQQRYPQ